MPDFGELIDVDIRLAWPHEAHDFTPWLAANLQRLSTAIGMPLELVDTEVAVESFTADILARNPQDDTPVLIENQFNASDHGHLGQIMTYLAGLDAKTIIWIAPHFRDAHLSAIRWLNDHTVEPFAFFAIQVRAVRIGESPLAPLFDVIERPNDWDRRVHTKAQEAQANSAIGDFRREFWKFFLTRHTRHGDASQPYGHPNRWIALDALPLVISYYLGNSEVGVFVRAPWGGKSEDLQVYLEPHGQALERDLGTSRRNNHYFFISTNQLDMKDRGNWEGAADWLDARVARYEQVLRDTLGDTSS